MKSRVRMVAMFRKEFYQMIRDPSTFLISIILPLILLFIYGYGVSLDIHNMPIGLLMEEQTPESMSFTQSLTNSPYFKVHVEHDRKKLDDDLISGKIRGFVVIPSYFTEFNENSDRSAPIQIIADGSEPNTAAFVQNYIRGAFQNWEEQKRISEKTDPITHIGIETRYWYNQELASRDFLLTGAIAIIMTLIGTLLTALVVSREWERGTMEALMTTPITIYELLIGKLVPYYCLGMVSMTICLVISVFYYGVPFRGSLLLLFFTASSFLISALSLGLLISTLAKNQFVAAQAAIVSAFFPAFMLSGFIFENSSMPKIINGISYLMPVRYFVTLLQSLFLVGNVWPLMAWNLIPMWVLTALLLLITLRKTVKRLD